MRFIFLLPLIGAVIGGFIVLATMVASGSAPQEAAGYAMACAFAVVPYVFARSMRMLLADSPAELTKRVIDAINSQNKSANPS